MTFGGSLDSDSRRHGWLGLLLGLTLAACTGSAGHPRGSALHTEIRDSAGVRIVENRGVAGVDWRTIEEPPLLEIAPVTGEGELLRVVGVRRLSDGSVVAASAGTNTIVVFDAAGTRRAILGRKGAGPGEFEGIQSLISLPADSFGVWDAQHVRLSIFTGAGLVREVSFAGEAGAGRLTVLAHIGADTWLVRPARTFGGGNALPQPGVVRDTTRFVLLQGPPGPVDTLTALPAGETFLSIFMEGTQVRGFQVRSLPVRRVAQAVAADSLIWTMSSDRWDIQVWRRDRSLAGLIRLDEAAKPFPAELYAAMKAAQLAAMDPGPQRDDLAAAWDRWPVPDLTPVMQGLRRASNGLLWVERYAALDTMPPVHAVFDGEGKVLGEVRLPRRFRAMDIGPDWIFGVWRDEDDLEWIRMYRLVPR